MALFNVSTFGDWETTDVGESLCENFKKAEKSSKKRKFKLENKGSKNTISSKSTENLKKIVTSCNKAKQHVKLFTTNTKIRSLKHKVLKPVSEDEMPLNTSENPTKKDSTHKKALHKKQKKKLKQKPSTAPMATNPDLRKETQIYPVESDIMSNTIQKRKKQLQTLQQMLEKQPDQKIKKKKTELNLTLRQKMMQKLKAARFRYLNEQIYTTTGKETQKIFKNDPDSFKAYHEGYKLQVKQWPVNPLDKIIMSISKMNKNLIIADFGCGEAKLAESVPQTVHSFDLVASNDSVIACDMARVPLGNASVDIVVFCLSLMGTNLKDYIVEANRVLKKGGLVKIAEVESRFDDVTSFIKACESYGFKNTWRDMSYNLFYFMDFTKVSDVVAVKKKLPPINLQPCLYKKR